MYYSEKLDISLVLGNSRATPLWTMTNKVSLITYQLFYYVAH